MAKPHLLVHSKNTEIVWQDRNDETVMALNILHLGHLVRASNQIDGETRANDSENLR
jgi:hypothetical protein